MPPAGLNETERPIGGTQLGVMTPSQVSDAIETAKTADQAAQFVQKPAMDALAAHVLGAYEANKTFRAEEFDALLLEDHRQFNGEYDPQKLQELARDKQPVIFYPATAEKTSGAHNWIMDVQNFDQGKSFTIQPTPLPDLSPEEQARIEEQAEVDREQWMADGNAVSPKMVFYYNRMMRERVINELMDEAKDRAKRMETAIYDNMVEGGWHKAYAGFSYNLTWAPVAYLKGPIYRRIRKKRHAQGPLGTYEKVDEVIAPTFECVSPYDIYFSRDAVEIEDGDLIERLKLKPSDLEKMKGVKGFQDEAIDKILAQYDGSSYQDITNTDSERAKLEGKGSDISAKKHYVEGLEYWGAVSGKLLKDKGVKVDVDGNALGDIRQYEANVIVVGNTVIYAAINPDVLGNRPYCKTSFRKKPGCWFGKGVPRLMRELQQILNATIRSMCSNMGKSSGFQTVINDLARVPAGENITESYPDKVWQFTKPNPASQEKPMDFFQPDSRSGEFINIYKTFKPEIDSLTGIPAYSYGSDQIAGSGRTLGGLNILMSNAARGIKMVLANIDQDIMRPMIQRLFDYQMKFSEDESIKGDVIVQCSGYLSQIVNQQNSELLVQFLNVTANPMDQGAVGVKQRAAALREFVKRLELPKDTLVMTDEEIDKELAKAEQAQAQMATQGGQPQQMATA